MAWTNQTSISLNDHQPANHCSWTAESTLQQIKNFDVVYFLYFWCPVVLNCNATEAHVTQLFSSLKYFVGDVKVKSLTSLHCTEMPMRNKAKILWAFCERWNEALKLVWGRGEHWTEAQKNRCRGKGQCST